MNPWWVLAVLAAVVVAVWASRRVRAASSRVDRILTDTPPATAALPQYETEPGINLADRDLCERLWNQPDHIREDGTP